MGLSAYDAAMLVELVQHLPRRQTVVCLGMPRLRFSARSLERWSRRVGGSWRARGTNVDSPLDARSFFLSLGFERCLALDMSGYEGAQIIHDLNSTELAEEHRGIADCVVDAGTLEHVFQLPAALGTIFELLRADGMVIHTTPANGYLDHGFYQISPTLYYDYYRANQFRVVSANLINRYPRVRCEPYVQDIYRERGMLYSLRRLPRATVFFAAAKTAASTRGVAPIQGYYRRMHDGIQEPWVNEHPFTYEASAGGVKGRVEALARGARRRLRSLLGG
jgi:hypothetical protein